MRTRGKGKRRFAIVLAMIMALQCAVFSTSAFAATDSLSLHVTNIYWAAKYTIDGQAAPYESVQTISKSGTKTVNGTAGFNWAGGKNHKETPNGVSYTFLNAYYLNDAGNGPVVRSEVDNSLAISKINYKGAGQAVITFQDGSTRTVEETSDLYISPVYSAKAGWRLHFYNIDNISTGSGSAYNPNGGTSGYSKTLKDPSKGTPKAHYQFVTWKNLETGETYGAGEKFVYSPKEQGFLNEYYANNGDLFEEEISVYAVWQPSVTVNWHDENGNTVKSIEEFANDIATNSYMASDLTGEEGETYTFEGWATADGSMADEVYTVPEVTVDPVDQKVIDLYPVYHTTKSVAKVWSDEENRDGLRAESIEVQLYADGEAAGEAVTLSEENGWAYTWEGLTALNNGKAVVYTVDEVSDIEGYEKDVQFTSLKDIIINSHAAEKISIDVTKIWEDNNDELNVRPMLIEVKLMANGEESQSLIMGPVNEDENGNWTASFEDLYKFENGEEIEYTVEESVIDDYEASIEGSAEEGFVITNVCTKEPPQPIIPDIPVIPADEDPADDNTPAAPADDDDSTPVIPASTNNSNNTPAAPTDNGSQNTPAASSDNQAAASIDSNAAPKADSKASAEITENAAPAAAAIEDEAAPQAASTGYWALINLLLTIGAALMSILTMGLYFTRRNREEDDEEETEMKKHGLARVLTIIPAIAAIVIFILTENMANPMRMVDDFTLLMAVLFIANVVLAVLSKKSRKDEEAEQQAVMAN